MEIIWIIVAVLLFIILIIVFCLFFRKSKSNSSEDQGDVKLLSRQNLQTEDQTESKYLKDQIDIRQKQNQIKPKHQQKLQTNIKYSEEDRSKIKSVESITEPKNQDQGKGCHQGQLSETDYQEKGKTKKYHQEEHQLEIEYQTYQIKAHSQEHATKRYHQEDPAVIYPEKRAKGRYHQEDQIKTNLPKNKSETDYQQKPKTENYHKRKNKKKRYNQEHQIYNQEAQASSKNDYFRKQNFKPEFYDSSQLVVHHPNLDFYRNKRKSEPDGDYIENILTKWFGDYDTLEYHHSYIQWLFPNRIAGLNRQAFCLTDYEIQEISKDEVLKERVIKSFRLMLNFYGMAMDDDCQFSILSNSNARIKNLKQRSHNFLRITRILTALGEFGLWKEQRNWLVFLTGMVNDGTLKEAEYSLRNFWTPAVEDFKENFSLNS